MKKANIKKGFTIVELIILIAAIVFLAVTVVPALHRFIKATNDGETDQNISLENPTEPSETDKDTFVDMTEKPIETEKNDINDKTTDQADTEKSETTDKATNPIETKPVDPKIEENWERLLSQKEYARWCFNAKSRYPYVYFEPERKDLVKKEFIESMLSSENSEKYTLDDILTMLGNPQRIVMLPGGAFGALVYSPYLVYDAIDADNNVVSYIVETAYTQDVETLRLISEEQEEQLWTEYRNSFPPFIQT